MVALVAFSGDSGDNIMLKSGFFATWLIQADSPKGVFRLRAVKFLFVGIDYFGLRV